MQQRCCRCCADSCLSPACCVALLRRRLHILAGVDRDSGLLRGFDERDPAVKALIGKAIASCLRKGKYVGICGQAPSDFPEITKWLVERGIGCAVG